MSIKTLALSGAALAAAATVIAAGAFALPAAAAVSGLASAGALCDNGASTTPFLTVTQAITEPDSATSGGNWANDSFTEQAVVWLGSDGTTFCAKGTIQSGGSFTTTGPSSPQNGVALQAGVTGTITGGETWILPTGTATTTSDSSVTLSADNATTTGQFNAWQSQVFDHTAGASTFYFNYVATNGSSWTNADATSGGNAGDITPVYNVTQGTGYATIQAAVAAAHDGDDIKVAPGTYSGDVTIANNDLTLESDGSGTVTLNLASGYGFDLDEPGNDAMGFTLKGFTVNASSGTTYAFKAYNADGLTLTNDTFNGGAGNTGGGVDVNTTNNVTITNVTATGFHKNGFAFTPEYDNSLPAADGITLTGITASNNNWAGVALYTVGNDHSPTSTGPGASFAHVVFGGTNTISGNTKGIQVEGDSDATSTSGGLPAYTVTSDGSTLNLGSMVFSGNSIDVLNYQTADVNAMSATFSGKTGSNMSTGERTAEDAKIYDTADNSFLGTVNYVAAPGCVFGFNPTTYASGDSSTLSWNCTSVNAPVVITDANGATTTATSTGSESVSIGTAGTYTYSLDTTENDASSTPIHADATLTVTSSAGGGGGGSTGGGSTGGGSIGGSGGSSNPLPGTTTPPPTTTPTPTPTGNGGGQVLGASTYNFTQDLWYHMKNNADVAALQTYLVAVGYSIPDAVTEFFGPETLAAVKAFQKDHGIPSTGYVGPLTRAVLNQGVLPTTPESQTNLTPGQAAAIISVLESFGADAATIAQVRAALGI